MTWRRQGDPLSCASDGIFASDSVIAVNWDLLSTKTSNLGRRCIPSSLRAMPTSTMHETVRSPGLVMGSVSFQQVVAMNLLFAAGTSRPGYQLDIPGLVNYDMHIFSITLNPASTLLASASHDRTVRLWGVPTGREVVRYEHSHWVSRVTFSADGRFLLSGGWGQENIAMGEIEELVHSSVQ